MSHLKLVKAPYTVKTGHFLVKMWTNHRVQISRDWTGMTDEAIRDVFDEGFNESFNEYDVGELSDFEVESFDIEEAEEEDDDKTY